jgi:hypothetical protein
MGDQKSVGSNQDSASSLRDSYSRFFDDRPDDSDIDGALYHKPSMLKQIGIWFRDVGAQFTAFFVGLGEGIASAWTAVKRAFGSEDQAQQAVRHIHQPIAAEARAALQSREQMASLTQPGIASSLRHSSSELSITATDTTTAPVISESVAASQAPPNASDKATISHSTPTDTATPASKSQATAAPVHYATHTPVELTDEDAFALFVDEFKQARREEREFSGAGRQQFEDAAKRHAQKLLDAELARLNTLGDRFADYALGTDQALAIEVASALLHHPLPHQKLLDLTGQTSVPSYSQQDMECFDAWLEWRETKILTGGKAIDLGQAVRYANEFIKKNANDPERAKSPEISRRLAQAYDLITHQARDEAEMNVKVALMSVEEAKADFSLVPLPAFPPGVTSLELQPINGGLQGNVIKQMIRATKQYFSMIRNAEEPEQTDKAQAIMFATLWKTGRSDPKILEEMKTWHFFEPLDQLLDLEKIKKDFK